MHNDNLIQTHSIPSETIRIVQSGGILEWLDKACRIFKEQTAIECGNKRISYSALNDITNRLANCLISNQLSKSSRIGVLLNNRIEIIISIIGILKASCTFVPLNPDLPEKRLRKIFEDISPACLITDSKYSHLVDKTFRDRKETSVIIYVDSNEYFNNFDDNSITSVDQSFTKFSSERRLISISPDDMCYIYYTSGSTGLPKGIVGTYKGLSHFIKWEIETFNITFGTRFSQFTAPTFDPFLRDLFVPLCVGGTICIPPEKSIIIDANLIIDWVDSNNINLIHCVPSLFEILVKGDLKYQKLNSLKYILLAGEIVHTSVVKKWMEVYDTRIKLINLYGPTETTLAKFYYEIQKSDVDRGFVPIGQPIKGAKALILDELGNVCPCGVFGELYINTPYRTLGYYNKPELTNEVFLINPFSKDPSSVIYKTGDLARVLNDGNYQFGGRKDNQVKIRGIRVELEEIENQLRNHNLIESAVVLFREDDFHKKRLVAYIVANQGTTIVLNDLQKYLQQHLPEYMVPSVFIPLDALPLTPNGKVDRKALPAPDGNIERAHEYIAPRTPSEEIIAHVYSQVLGIDRVSIHDNFFELGGHSLLATQLISRLRQSFEVELPLKALFESPTIAQLDPVIQQLRTQGQGLNLPAITRTAPEQKDIPLSFAQERLWFLDQLEGASATYNIPAALRLKGELNREALEQALGELVRRHEVLRTSFVNEGGTPRQLIHPSISLEPEVVDLQHLHESEQQGVLTQQIQEFALMPFELAVAPLIRCCLWQISEQEHVFGVNLHHIISDGWSTGVLIREVSALYAAYCAGEASPLPELEIQYADFALWQRQYLSGATLEEQLHYWQQQLQGAPELLQLPTDRPRPSVQSYRGATHTATLRSDLTAQLQTLSRQCGTTMFMTLLSAFATLLYRYSGQTDVVVGSPIANRNRREIEGLIGFFVNTLVLRTRLEDNPRFEEILTQVRETTLAAYEHQDVPFEQVVEALQPQRSLSHSPLFQVMFALQNAPTGEIALPGITLEACEPETTTAKFDLMLSVSETPEGLGCSWEYSTDLFDRATLERMAAHFENLLTAIVDHPQQQVSEIPLLSEAGRHQLLVEWNDTAREYPQDKCIHQLFEEQVHRTPDAVAVVFEQQQVTYQQLNEQANQLAHHLQSLGVGPEVLVGICVERSVEMVVGLLGILKAGGAYVPLDPTYPQERLAFMMEDAAVTVLLTQQALVASLPTGSTTVVCLDTDWEVINQHPQENLVTAVSAENLVYVIYTSGSTGQPKGVAVEHQNVVRLFAATQSWYQLNDSDVWTNFHSIAFDFSVWEIWGALLYGGRLVVVPYWVAREPQAFYQLLYLEQVTVLNQTPSAFYQLTNIKSSDTSGEELGLRLVIFGGEALDLQNLEPWFENHGNNYPQLVNMYGITEVTVHATYQPLTISDLNSGRSIIGCPLPDLQVYILDARLQPVPIGVAGELHVGGDGLARGYLNRPELTAEKFIANPFSTDPSARLYKTGDLARYLPDGNIEYLGRIDHQVKIRGFRIELGEVEAVLTQHPQVQQAVVTAPQDAAGNKRLVAYVVSAGEAPSTPQLRDYLQHCLPEYMVPGVFVVLDALPLTPNGKVDRRALPTPEGNIIQEGELILPRNMTELKLAQIWSETLSVSPIGVTSNFFELGGNSLLSVVLMSKIKQQFQRDLPLASLFRSPTIETLATLLYSNTDSLSLSTIVPIQTQGNRPPLFCIHPGGGNILCYQYLSYHLGSEQPFYGIQSVGINPKNEPHTSIEQMAAYYIQELKFIQAHGPYFLLGWSLGGLIAFDMARQLVDQGEQVALLGLIDSYPFVASPGQRPEPESEAEILANLSKEYLDLCSEELQKLAPDKQLIYVIEQAKQRKLIPENIDMAHARHFLKIYKLNSQAGRNYKPQYYSNPIVLFRAINKEKSLENDPAYYYDWSQLVEKVETYFVPADHHNIVEPPQVEVLAAEIRKSLNQAW
ncbi:MAG: non-ribosomal peptide synthetase [Hapalosiphonaceae cyanobacterium JJU2]|nr:MAG: non-ribosomal peptide synthetase [Hapalosiphonaceae cyanobacterium JJU2]